MAIGIIRWDTPHNTNVTKATAEICQTLRDRLYVDRSVITRAALDHLLGTVNGGDLPPGKTIDDLIAEAEPKLRYLLHLPPAA